MFRWIKNPRSLKQHVVVISIITALLLTSLSGVAIIWSFHQSMDRLLLGYLTAYSDVLIAATRIENGKVIFKNPQSLANLPRYWQVTTPQNHIAKSPTLSRFLETKNRTAFFTFKSQNGEEIVAITKTVTFPRNVEVTYLSGMQSGIAFAFLEQEKQAFYTKISMVLGGLMMAFILLSLLYVHIITSPFERIKNALSDIRSSKKKRLGKDFPKEIQPMAHEINMLLDYNKGIIERYQTFAGNLSHALKTPLSVLKNEASSSKSTLAKKVLEKVEIMQKLVDRNLARVKATGNTGILGADITIYPTIARIAKNFGKLHNKVVKTEGDENLRFQGNDGDLYEMVGNIVENACIYACEYVHITLTEEDDDIHIIVEDDGPGIPEEKQYDILGRGTRLDEATPGTGIGLAITQDLVELYEGKIVLGKSTLGGLKVAVILPQLNFV